MTNRFYVPEERLTALAERSHSSASSWLGGSSCILRGNYRQKLIYWHQLATNLRSYAVHDQATSISSPLDSLKKWLLQFSLTTASPSR